MNKKIEIVFILVLCTIAVSAQINRFGVPEVVNYPPGITNGSEQNWAVVQDKRGIMYFGNDEKGVLEYDGNEWRPIPIPNNSIVRSLACSDQGTVYVGAVSEIGFLAPNTTGLLEYQSLLPMLDSSERRFSHVWKTYCTENKVYFYSEKHTFIYYPEPDSIHVVPTEMHTLFGFYENNNFYFGIFPKGLMVMSGDTAIVPATGGDFYKNKDIFGLAGYDEKHLLIGVYGKGLSLYNTESGEVDSLFAPKSTNQFLNDNFLTQLTALSNGKFVASTVGGGIALIERNGHISEIVSKDEGLQNQTIYSSYQPSGNYPYSHVWAAMSIGVGKINFESPLRKFTEQSGYQGLIHAINSIDDIIFIGTASGLYKGKISNNRYSFEKIENINRQVWDLQKFTLHNGEIVLLLIGENGLMQINKKGQLTDLKDKIIGVEDEYDRVFWGYKIFADPSRPDRVFLGMESSFTSLGYKNGSWIQEFAIDSLSGEVRSLAISPDEKLWFGAKLAGIGCYYPLNKNGTIKYYGVENGLPTRENNSVFRINEEILIGTSDGIYRIFDSEDTLYCYRDTLINRYLPKGKNAVLNIYLDPSSTLWISFENEKTGWSIASLQPAFGGEEFTVTTKPFYSLENFSTDAFFSTSSNDIWFSKSNILYHYDKSISFNKGEYSARIRKVTVGIDSVIFSGAFPESNNDGGFKLAMTQQSGMIPQIKYSDNNIEFRWSAPYFDQEEKLEFSYYLEGFSKVWSDWENVYYQDFTNLPRGSYTFRIKAKNVYQEESLVDEFSFVILRPWYITFVALLSYIIAAILLVYLIIVLYTRRLKNENIRLEGIIQERTTEIRKQKEELTDSIEYASRIQRALLPPDQMLSSQNLDHFILFRPRDIVSGDFYWFGNNNGKIFIVAADCTGHGVPGAFMSMLGISFLDEIVIKSGISETNRILDALRNHVITSLRQTGKSMEESTRDGMDLAMVAIDEKAKTIQFSGAYNPLYAVRALNENEKELIKKGVELDLDRGTIHNETHILYQVKADQMPIGISEKNQSFTASTIDDPSATIYLFSDGYVDQFGGSSGKKFMSRNFKKLLLDIQHLSLDKQRTALENTLLEWMGNISQIDDVLVIGIRLK